MKFRFYITDTFDGSIRGTDSEQQAQAYAQSEDNFVVDTLHGLWLQPDDILEEVIEATELDLEDEDEEE